MDCRTARSVSSRLAAARRVTVVTGAGVSAPSGVPTFRGPTGLWRSHRPEKLATPEAFDRNPKLIWEWYQWRRRKIAECRPNRAHEVLAAWSRMIPEFHLVTQNVDGLHERAGTEGVIRFHGSIWEVRCRGDCPDSPPRWWDETIDYPELPPPCPHCDGIIRPGVVWFGELIPDDAVRESNLATVCDLCLVVGTSSVVYPAAGLASAARAQGAFTIEINVERTPASNFMDLTIQESVDEALDAIHRQL